MNANVRGRQGSCICQIRCRKQLGRDVRGLAMEDPRGCCCCCCCCCHGGGSAVRYPPVGRNGGSLWAIIRLLLVVGLCGRLVDGKKWELIRGDEMGSVEALQAGSLNGSRRALDSILQEYALKALVRPRTGKVYDAQAPSNLSGIGLAAVRLRSGSLWKRGIRYNEFQIPVGVLETPYVQRLVLVYQNLGNWSSLYYNKPGYELVAPVLGLLAYDASNLSATGLPELGLVAMKQPISIRFTDVMASGGLTPICISFNLNGSVTLSNATSPNVCSTIYQGHFSLIVESLAPSPAPLPGPVPAPSPAMVEKRGKSNRWKVVLGSVLGAVAALLLLGLIAFALLKYRRKSQIAEMEHQADQGEALQMAVVGGSRTPAAALTRTQPMLENEYVP